MRKRRILHLITRLDLGGAQQNTLFCTAHHDRHRFEVDLVAGRGGLLDEEAVRIADARVSLVPYLRHPVSPFWDLSAIVRLTGYLRARGIELIHTHSSKAGIVGRIAASLAGVRAVVHTVHGWSFNDSQDPARRRLYIALERWAARGTDRLVVVAAAGREVGLALGIGREEQYRVIHSGIDIGRYRRPGAVGAVQRRLLGFDDRQIVVGTVACLKPQKAPLDFVDAAAAAFGRNRALRFVVIGDGELRPAVEARVRERGLDGVVRLLGWRRDVPDLLQAMDVFLLTSVFEGLPRAVLQAMAAGVPVVATAVDGTPEVVRDGVTGLLIPPRRPDEAATAVLRMCADEELRRECIENARRLMTRAFDIRAMVGDLDDLYSELLDPNRS